MRLLITGDTPRAEEARRECLRQGHSLPAHGPWDAVLLPLPRSEITEEEADMLPRGQQVICGLTAAAFDSLAARRGWTLLRILNDEAFSRENAALSAEGAVFAAMRERDAAIKDARCLVIGYGRIGQELTALLRGLGARAAVAARRKESREAAGGGVSMEEIPALLPDTDIVFNTVPAPILTAAQLSLLPEGALYLELASPPYGIDPEAAKQTGVHYILESGIPGRYCPRSAARAMIDYLERTVNAL